MKTVIFGCVDVNKILNFALKDSRLFVVLSNVASFLAQTLSGIVESDLMYTLSK